MANKVTRRRLVDEAIKSTNLAVQSGLIINELMKNRDEMDELIDAFFLDLYDYEDAELWRAKVFELREKHKKKEEAWHKDEEAPKG